MTVEENSGRGNSLVEAIGKQIDLPTTEFMLLELPLYQPVPVAATLLLSRLRRHALAVDAYCIECERITPFRNNRTLHGGVEAADINNGQFVVEMFCARCTEKYLYIFNHTDKVLTKIGQYPSIADISVGDLAKYKSLLRDGYFGELSKAIGLISHGVGIGAFVYLRRIFEKLIWDHHAEAIATGVDLTGFKGMRMDDKIDALKTVLPPALVKNRKAYAILSKGIHELSEEEAKAFFPVVKAAIIQMLEEDFQARERRKAADDLERAVEEIAGRLGNKAKE